MKDTMTIDKAIEIHRGLKDIAEKHNIMMGAFYNAKEFGTEQFKCALK